MTVTRRPPFKIPRSVLVVIHTPALDVLLIERADKPGYWQSVTGSLGRRDEPLDVTATARGGRGDRHHRQRPCCRTGSRPTSTRSTRSGATAMPRA
jgi:8-oxo-dGTP pyrophosphatase MutT (NUDIX family)